MGWCETLLPFFLDPLTYLIGGGSLLGLGLLYSYSSYAFLPSMIVLSRLTSPFNFVLNLIKTALQHNALRYLAVYTTFEGTIKSLLNQGFTLETGAVLLNELWNKIVLSFKNIVDGLEMLVQWLTSSSEVCGLAGNTDILFTAGISIWTGIAAYIFVLWVWKFSFYHWRNIEMEDQNVFLVLVAITAISIAAHQTSLVMEGVSNGMSLVETLGQLVGDVGVNESVNGTK